VVVYFEGAIIDGVSDLKPLHDLCQGFVHLNENLPGETRAQLIREAEVVETPNVDGEIKEAIRRPLPRFPNGIRHGDWD